MAKKKNQSKKHKFKYADPTAATAAPAPVANGEQSALASSSSGRAARPAVFAGPTRDFSYVGGDLRRILVLAVVLVGLEFALWFLFEHTGVGNQVYNLVKV